MTCELCNDTGVVTMGEFDDVVEKKCLCQIEEDLESKLEDKLQDKYE